MEDLITSPPCNQERRTKIPRNVFWGILVLGSLVGDLVKSLVVQERTRGDLIKSPPLSLGTKILKKSFFLESWFLFSWFHGGGLTKSLLVKTKEAGDSIESLPHVTGTEILSRTFLGILVLGSLGKIYLRASGSGRRPQRRMARLQISGHYAYRAVRSDLTPALHFCPRATAAGSLH